MLDRIAELEEAYNMNIEFVQVPWEEYVDTFTTSVLAGEPFRHRAHGSEMGVASDPERPVAGG